MATGAAKMSLDKGKAIESALSEIEKNLVRARSCVWGKTHVMI